MELIQFRRIGLSILIAQLFPLIACAEGNADIQGHVQDAKLKGPAQGVVVTITETGKKVATDKDGAFAFKNIASGIYTLVITADGNKVGEQIVTVSDKKNAHPEITIGKSGDAVQQVTIQGQFTPAAVTRAAQREALNIINITTSTEMKKLPDVNTGEAVRRLPGVSLETDEGEGRYVNIRGLDADLNSTTFGGVRLPPTNNASPFGGYRAVTFDSIPIGLVGAITVTKTNLPAQDAEALGGAIEITPKTAPLSGKPFLQGNIGTGREQLRGTNITDISLSGGGRFGGGTPDDSGIVSYRDRPFSFVGTLAYYEDKRGIDDVEPAYLDNSTAPHDAYSAVQQRYYQLHRRRHGFGLDFGYQPDANNSYYVRAFDAGHTENYVRNMMSISPDGNVVALGGGQYSDTLNGSNALQKVLRDEQETIRDRVFVIGGKNKFESSILDYRVAMTKGSYEKPYDYYSTFAYAPAGGVAPNAGINNSLAGQGSTPRYLITGTAANDYTNPNNYTLSNFSNSTASNYDKELSIASNLDTEVHWGGYESENFKIGESIRLRKKQTNSPQFSYQNLTLVPLTNAVSGGNVAYYDGQYQNGPNINTGYLQGLFGSGTQTSGDLVATAQQYLNAKEDVYAAYGQYDMTQGKFSAVGGVRFEGTRNTYDAFGFNKDASGNVSAPIPVSGSRNYSNFFPSAQVKYEIEPKFQVRASFSTTIARPGFNQVNPSTSVDAGAGIVNVGNPNLKPAYAYSFDISIEKYLNDAGILSIGVFDKQIKDYIAAVVTSQSFANSNLFAGLTGPVKVYSYSNLAGSYARGLELNYEQRFKDLGVFSGLGLGFNWTYVDSSFQIRPGETSSLPSSSKNTANATVFYEHNGLNLRLAEYYVSANLFAIVGPGLDVYNAARKTVDFGGTYNLNKNLAVYFNAKNLLDTPHTFYEGEAHRVIQREFYGRTYQIGLNFNY